MLLESRVNEKITLLIDCESQGGVDKNAVGGNAHPDDVIPSAVKIIQAAAEQMGVGLSLAVLPAPVSMEVEFGVRVDANAIVALARTPEEAHFRVRLRWDG
jgi:hypothetical protein